MNMVLFIYREKLGEFHKIIYLGWENRMKFQSTRGLETGIKSADAIIRGIAKDGGLYVPESFPKLYDSLKDKKSLSYVGCVLLFFLLLGSLFIPDKIYELKLERLVEDVEKYIDTCLTSLLNQTYDKLQIIIVDDGSTDES